MFEDIYYNEIFDTSINAAKLVLAVLIWRYVETKRKTANQELYQMYPFLGYASNIVSMIIGELLLRDFGIKQDKIDHINFKELKGQFELNKDSYYEEAMNMLKNELESERLHVDLKLDSLQKIAGVFRSGYLTQSVVQKLKKNEEK